MSRPQCRVKYRCSNYQSLICPSTRDDQLNRRSCDVITHLCSNDYFMSPKYDGWHVIWDGNKLWTKNLKICIDTPLFLLSALQTVFGKKHLIAGELVVQDKDATSVGSIVRDANHEDWKRTHFYVFDGCKIDSHITSLPDQNDDTKNKSKKSSSQILATKPFNARYKTLLKRVQKFESTPECAHIHLCDQTMVHTDSTEVMNYLHTHSCENKNIEGVVLTHSTHPWVSGKYKEEGLYSRYKIKHTLDSEAIILGHIQNDHRVSLFVKALTLNKCVQSQNRFKLHHRQYLKTIDDLVTFRIQVPKRHIRSNSSAIQDFPVGSIINFRYMGTGSYGKPKSVSLVGLRSENTLDSNVQELIQKIRDHYNPTSAPISPGLISTPIAPDSISTPQSTPEFISESKTPDNSKPTLNNTNHQAKVVHPRVENKLSSKPQAMSISHKQYRRKLPSDSKNRYVQQRNSHGYNRQTNNNNIRRRRKKQLTSKEKPKQTPHKTRKLKQNTKKCDEKYSSDNSRCMIS